MSRLKQRRSRKRKNKVLKHREGFIATKKKEILASLEIMAKINYNVSLKQVKWILILASIIGFSLGLLVKNLYLAITFGCFFPYFFVEWLKIQKSSIQSMLDGQAIKYANLIKNSYIATNQIKSAIEQNIPLFEEPIKTLFEKWIEDVELFNYSYQEAFERMHKNFTSKSLKDFTDQLIMCDKDRTYLSSLEATISQLNDRRAFMARWENKKKDMLRKYYFLAGIMVGLTIFIMFAYGEVAEVFLQTDFSKIVIAIYSLVILASTAYVLRQVNNIEL